jgi:hypothetical protein
MMKLRETIGRKVFQVSAMCEMIGIDSDVRISVAGWRQYRRLVDAVTDALRASQQFSPVYPPLLLQQRKAHSTFLQHSLVRRLVCVSDTVAAVMRVADIL